MNRPRPGARRMPGRGRRRTRGLRGDQKSREAGDIRYVRPGPGPGAEVLDPVMADPDGRILCFAPLVSRFLMALFGVPALAYPAHPLPGHTRPATSRRQRRVVMAPPEAAASGADAVRRRNANLAIIAGRRTLFGGYGGRRNRRHRRKPILCGRSTPIKEPGHPDGRSIRAISPEMRDGRVDPAGMGCSGSPVWQRSCRGMICHLFRLIDAVGIDHVGSAPICPPGWRSRMPDFSPLHWRQSAAACGPWNDRGQVAKCLRRQLGACSGRCAR